jgi:A/G-specific adenine glycosylase
MQEVILPVAAERQRRKGARSGPAAPLIETVIADPAALRRRLAAWYGRARRDLPWRRSRDPYRVWVSEIMLQQTQVERVKEFFVRFMETFPTVADLAAASEQKVLKHWEGLGYYRRARQLHAAAKVVVRDHGGEFPRTVAGLMELPGVGRYTAGAIASIAMDLPAPIVEANSRRVIARLAGHDRPVGHAGDEPIWNLAAALVPRKGAGTFNQALMDLGAIICTPGRPRCDHCPVAASCAARREGREEEIPLIAAPRATKRIRERAIVERHGDRVLVERRGKGEWWEGLWDFPREPARTTAGGAAKGRSLGRVTYTVTHHRIECTVVERSGRAAAPVSGRRRWVKVAALSRLAMTAPGRRIARLLAAAGPARHAAIDPGARERRARTPARRKP